MGFKMKGPSLYKGKKDSCPTCSDCNCGLNSPMKKISASCKAQAKKKFKVWPSAYASGWGVRCTRGDFKKKK